MAVTERAKVSALSRSGVSLVEIIFSGVYSKEVRDEALRLLRWNVSNLHREKDLV